MAEAAFFLYYHKQVERKLKEIGAISEETATKPEELGKLGLSKPCISFLRSPLRKRLARIAGDNIRETSDGRYYIERKDEIAST